MELVLNMIKLFQYVFNLITFTCMGLFWFSSIINIIKRIIITYFIVADWVCPVFSRTVNSSQIVGILEWLFKYLSVVYNRWKGWFIYSNTILITLKILNNFSKHYSVTCRPFIKFIIK